MEPSIQGDRNITVRIDGNDNYVLISQKRQLTFRRPSRREIKTELDILRADAQAIPFQARQLDLELLHAWLQDPKSISVLAVIGQGGAGKTRLGLELLNQTESGWAGGFVQFQETESLVQSPPQPSTAQPLLAIVDYASAHTDAVRQLLQNLARYGSPFPQLRILLLERHADPDSGWYQRLFDYSDSSDTTALFHQRHPHQLSAVDANKAANIFGRTLDLSAAFHANRPRPTADLLEAAAFAEPRFGDPLVLMMAALASWDGGVLAALRASRPDLATRLARREISRIEDRFPNDDGLRARALTHLAAHSTLCGGFAEAQLFMVAREECEALGLQYPGGPNALTADLVKFLPGQDSNGSGTVQPDIIGEAFFQLTDVKGVDRAVRRNGSAAAQALVHALQDYNDPHGARQNLDPSTPSGSWALGWLRILGERATAGDANLLSVLDSSMPVSTVELRELATDLLSRLLELLPSDLGTNSSATAERARLHNNLSSRLGELGRLEEALAAAAEAVQIRRRLAQSHPDAFLPALAQSLHNYGTRLSELGRRDEALSAVAEAVEFQRALAQSRPDAFLPDLALSLNNYGTRLSELGRREEALSAVAEAVKVQRVLAPSRPAAVLPALAQSLNNYGTMLSELGRREEALAAAAEAVEILRRLAQSRPDAFLPDLAKSLNNYAIVLSQLGRREEALSAVAEAVEFQRALAQSRPDAFLPDLALSLNNYGTRLSDLGRREQALAAAAEAVEIRRRLAQSHPDAFLPDLALSLNNYGARLSDLGRRKEALAALTEIVPIYRGLAQSRPDAFLPNLAQSLNNYAMLGELGRAEEPLAEAVEIRRRLAQSRPDAFLPNLAQSLSNYGLMLSALGRREEALATAAEAVEIRRRLAQSRPDAFLPDLATSLGVLGTVTEPAENAAATFKEAIRVLLPHFTKLPQAHAGLMTALYREYSDRCQQAKIEPAADLLAPIVEIFRTLNQGPTP